MRTILIIALNDLSIFFRQRGNLIGLLVIPVLLTTAVGWANSSNRGSEPTYLRVDVIDQDQTAASADLLAQLRLTDDTLVLCPQDNDAADRCDLDNGPLTQPLAMERAQAETTGGLLIIPAGYGAAVTGVQPAQLDYYSADDPLLPGAVSQAVASVLQQVNRSAVTARVGANLLASLTQGLPGESALPAEVESAVYAHAEARFANQPPLLRYATTNAAASDTAEASGIQRGFGQSVPGMSTLYVIFTVLAGTVILLRERRQWTLQRLAAMPLTRAQILGGKILTYFTLGMIQYAIVFTIGLVVGLDLGNDLPAMLALMAAFTLCMTALALALATRVTSEGQANGLRNLIALTLAPLGGAWWPLEIVPSFMQRIGHLSPVAWVMDGFQQLIFNQGTFVDVLPEIGILLAIALVFFLIGIRGFRVQ